ncbi:MAG: hypothetical protein EON87_13540, partial [Brevundimonas sp.]
MFCGATLAISLLLTDPAVALAAEQPPAVAGAPVSVASEPLFADIVARSGDLRGVVRGWMDSGIADQPNFLTGEAFTGFKA